MDNQHRKISGYRELTQADIDLMNKIKALGPLVSEVIAEVKSHVGAQRNIRPPADADADASVAFMLAENSRLNDAEPERWAAIARTHFQEGLMALTRAVAQPTFF